MSHSIGSTWKKELSNKRNFDWGKEDYEIEKDKNGHINIKKKDRFTLINHDSSEYNYINSVTYLTYPENSPTSYLFILSRLRATSFKSILSVFSNTGDLVYKELMDANNVVGISKINNAKVVIIGDVRPVYQKEPLISVKKYVYRIR